MKNIPLTLVSEQCQTFNTDLLYELFYKRCCSCRNDLK